MNPYFTLLWIAVCGAVVAVVGDRLARRQEDRRAAIEAEELIALAREQQLEFEQWRQEMRRSLRAMTEMFTNKKAALRTPAVLHARLSHLMDWRIAPVEQIEARLEDDLNEQVQKRLLQLTTRRPSDQPRPH